MGFFMMFYGDFMGIHGIFHGIYWDLPGLVNIQKAIENGHRNSGFSQL